MKMTMMNRSRILRCRCSDRHPLRLMSAVVVLFSMSAVAMAQENRVGVLPKENERLSMSAISVGNLGVLDEYMSPRVYSGISVGLDFQRNRRLVHQDDWLYTSDMKVSFGNMTGKNGTGWMMSMMLDGHYSWEKVWMDTPALSVTAGPLAYAKVGGLFNLSNSNNPATLKLYLAAGISGKAIYRLKIRNYPIALSCRLNMPLAGYSFSPTYALQYYEIYYLNRFGEASHFGWPGNLLALNHQLSVDIPVRSLQVRFSYSGDYYRCNIGGVRCKMYDNSVLVGIIRRLEIKHNGR